MREGGGRGERIGRAGAEGGGGGRGRGGEGGKGEGDIEGGLSDSEIRVLGATSSHLSWAISIPRVSCAAQLLLWEASFNGSLGGHTQARCDKINAQAREPATLHRC